jgi:hypothetical protein
MKELKVNITTTITVPIGATTLSITHEWGDIIATNVAVSGTYAFTPTSIGVHKFVWSTGQTDFYEIVLPMATSVDFFTDYPDLETTGGDAFVATERRVRKVIEKFTGQKFGPYVGKSQEIQGDGGDTLALPVRCTALTSVQTVFGDTLTDVVELGGDSDWYVRYKATLHAPYRDIKRDIYWRGHDFFKKNMFYVVTGNWGWEYVPNDVVEASKLLLADGFGDLNDLRKHGINRAQLGDFEYYLNADQWGTTGNTEADLLLSPYVILNLGLA